MVWPCLTFAGARPREFSFSALTKEHDAMTHAQKTIVLVAGLLVGMIGRTSAAAYVGYTALDPSRPVSFDGKTVSWNGKTFTLSPNTIFLDSRLDRAQLAANPHAFNNLKDAVAALQSGTAEKPMMLLTAPGVYWVDDPNDPAIRGGDGGAPVGMSIVCNYLYFYGLSTKWENVVFAVNRGQTQGSTGNYTMFNIQGIGLKSENVTFGNYCNVDLKFPLNPSLNRAKRADAISQAQLFSYNGGDGVAINSAFVSRLNLLPFARTYINCHIESSGHSGGGNVFINSTLEFYGTNFSGGRIFFNCDIYLKPYPATYQGRSSYSFGVMDGTGSGGIAIDTRIHRSQELIDKNVAAQFSWDRAPQSPLTRAYQYNVTMDGKPYVIQEAATPGATVVIPEGSELLKAFKVTHNGQTYYNVPNVSGVDPFGYTEAIKAAAKAAGKDENYYLSIPTGASLRVADGQGGAGRGGPAGATIIRSGQTTATLIPSVTPAASASSAAMGKWQFKASNPDVVQITPGADGSITVAGTNKTAAPVDVILVAKNELGVEAAIRLTVEPAYVDPPKFTRDPAITSPANGRVKLDYVLDLGSNLRKDESNITWYRCTDAQGSNSLKVAVSRRNKPEIAYTLSDGDVGSYLMAAIAPKHSVSEAGPLKTAYTSAAITKDDVKIHTIDTDFQNFPADAQPKILPGTWTVNSWTYGPGQAGSIDYFGLYQTARGARLSYTPADKKYNDMTVRAKLAPNKSTGQGFGSATDQYMDIYIKYDFATNTGYGLRIQRLTTEEIKAIGYNGAGAVAGCVFFLARFDNGVMTPVSKKVMSSAFQSECTVDLIFKNGRLAASVTSIEETRSGDAFDYPKEVRFDELVEANSYGGTGTLFTGTVGVNAVLVTGWRTSWTN
jgi:hypothetical protein